MAERSQEKAEQWAKQPAELSWAMLTRPGLHKQEAWPPRRGGWGDTTSVRTQRALLAAPPRLPSQTRAVILLSFYKRGS